MATFRVGVGSFNINDGTVGIGTEGSGHGNLKVEGTARASVVDVVGGASTFTRYSGFSANQVSVNDRNFLSVYNTLDKNNRILELTGETQTTGDIIVDDRTVLKVGLGSTACVGSLEYVCVKNHFSVPTGGTNQRNSSVYVEGTIRYNTDLGTMEFFNGNEWRQFTYQSDTGNRGRMVIFGGEDNPLSSTVKKTIQYQNIHTKGNTINFGSTQDCGGAVGGVSSEIRGVMAGRTPVSESMEYVTLASTGDSIDFGDLSGNREHLGGVSSSTRGIFAGGLTPSQTNIMEYVQIMTLGNAIDFGDLTTTEAGASTGSNGVTGIICSDGKIQQITIASTGNAVNVGNDLFSGSYKPGGASSGTRVMWAGGYNGGSGSTDDIVNASIRGINFASVGNATEFGTLTRKRNQVGGGGSRTRGVWMGGRVEPSPSWVNIIDYVSLQSGGAAEDFGDLIHEVTNPYPVSDCHGGLGGY